MSGRVHDDAGSPQRRRQTLNRLSRVRLHVVTGKGGTGKTTVSAALAIALATGGRKVLVAEVEERQGLAQVLDTPPLAFAEQHMLSAPGGGEVYGLAVEPHKALLEYLDMYYHLGPAGRTLERIGAVEFATTVAPGLRDVLLTGKIYEATKRRTAQERFEYDAIVLDGPPTGRIARFLNVSQEVAGLAKMGPIHRQAASITNMFRSPVTAVHIVTQLEEMPAQETADAVTELSDSGLGVGYLILNMVTPSTLRPRDVADIRGGELDPARVADTLKRAGVSEPAITRELVDGAVQYARRVASERSTRRALRELERPMVELPFLGDGVDVGGVYELATALAKVGAA